MILNFNYNWSQQILRKKKKKALLIILILHQDCWAQHCHLLSYDHFSDCIQCDSFIACHNKAFKLNFPVMTAKTSLLVPDPYITIKKSLRNQSLNPTWWNPETFAWPVSTTLKKQTHACLAHMRDGLAPTCNYNLITWS